jgi:hypothetical protein
LAEAGVSSVTSRRCAEQGTDWLNDMPVRRLEELDLNGKELLAHLNRSAGPWVSQVLTHLLQKTALKRLCNEKQELLMEAERYLTGSNAQESGSV